MSEEIKKIKVNGVTLAYREIGRGDKYLISTQTFFLTDCHMALLGREPYDYHVFLIYMRGYGESDHIFDSRPHDYTKIWGEDVIAFAQAMGIESFYYSGVSHGNWAGWYIAFHRPELLRGFFCCDGIAQFRRDEEQGVKAMQHDEEEIEELVGNRGKLEKMAWMEQWPTNNPQRLARREKNHLEHLEILASRRKEEFLVKNSSMTACEAQTEEEFYERLSQIPVPVMIWNGVLDPLARVEDCLKIAKTIPGAHLLTYQHLGHGGADECPEIAARDCDRFFSDTKGRIL